jgi:Bacterial Ig domain
VPAAARPAPPLRVRSDPAVNHNPVANDDNLAAFAGQDFQTLYLLDNDTDVDADPLTIFSTTVPAHGNIFLPNDHLEVDYTHFPGYSGPDSFNYRIIDGNGGSAIGTVMVTVAAPGATGLASRRFAISACLPSPSGCDTSIWTVNPKSGATGDTASRASNGGAGLGVDDANLLISERVNAFDTGLTLWVNGQQFQPSLPMTVTHYSLVSGPVTMAGVRVTVRYDGLLGSESLRTLVTFNNTSGITKNITATLASNVGSNNHTAIAGSSSGDTSFTTAGRWLVTGNADLLHQGGIVDTHVLFGPGSPAVTPSAVYTTTFTCGETPPSSEGVRADFHVSIPAGTTRRLLFFNQAHDNNEDALADATVFDSEPVAMLGGLTSGQLTEVVNWTLVPVSQAFLPLLDR